MDCLPSTTTQRHCKHSNTQLRTRRPGSSAAVHTIPISQRRPPQQHLQGQQPASGHSESALRFHPNTHHRQQVGDSHMPQRPCPRLVRSKLQLDRHVPDLVLHHSVNTHVSHDLHRQPGIMLAIVDHHGKTHACGNLTPLSLATTYSLSCLRQSRNATMAWSNRRFCSTRATAKSPDPHNSYVVLSPFTFSILENDPIGTSRYLYARSESSAQVLPVVCDGTRTAPTHVSKVNPNFLAIV